MLERAPEKKFPEPSSNAGNLDCVNAFAHDYASARVKFREAADSAYAELVSYEHGEKGPDGLSLSTDVALLGNPSAERVLFAVCGTHGVEGFCGSGAFVGWLRAGGYRALGANVRVVLIHAINPHGFAWLRRVTEDNVDLNRNFITHNGKYPEEPEFAKLMPLMIPEKWDESSIADLDRSVTALELSKGVFETQAILSRGQYQFPEGIFFGGHGPTWSNRTFNDIVGRYVQGATQVAFIDFHTGLGPYGTAELIHGALEGSAEKDRLQTWYRHGLASPFDGTLSAASRDGLLESQLKRLLTNSQVTAMTMEFGTYPIKRIFKAVLADNWLHLNGDVDSEQGRSIKAEIRQCFFPDEDDWKELVYLRSRQIFNRAINRLEHS